MRIACVSAAEFEIEWLLGHLDSLCRHKVGRGRLWLGELGPHSLALFCCGVGPENARLGMQVFSPAFAAQRVYHLGVCGSLADGLEPGTPVLAGSVVSSYAPGEQAVGLELPAAEELLQAAPGLPVRRELLLTHREPVLSEEERASLNRRYGASCVDMEAWEVAVSCRDAGVPLTVIKSVSDMAAADALSEFSRHSRRAAETSCKLVYGLMLHR
ncbi:MAG: hypothetical protein JXQ83_05500 [Candidatus Glassbacteria bacterium]|nr:hypothetical protein [Candidatus Glassbacteria bacterium]